MDEKTGTEIIKDLHIIEYDQDGRPRMVSGDEYLAEREKGNSSLKSEWTAAADPDSTRLEILGVDGKELSQGIGWKTAAKMIFNAAATFTPSPGGLDVDTRTALKDGGNVNEQPNRSPVPPPANPLMDNSNIFQFKMDY